VCKIYTVADLKNKYIFMKKKTHKPANQLFPTSEENRANS